MCSFSSSFQSEDSEDNVVLFYPQQHKLRCEIKHTFPIGNISEVFHIPAQFYAVCHTVVIRLQSRFFNSRTKDNKVIRGNMVWLLNPSMRVTTTRCVHQILNHVSHTCQLLTTRECKLWFFLHWNTDQILRYFTVIFT